MKKQSSDELYEKSMTVWIKAQEASIAYSEMLIDHCIEDIEMRKKMLALERDQKQAMTKQLERGKKELKEWLSNK